MKTLNNLKLRIMVRAFRIRLNNGEAFEAIAADYPALTRQGLTRSCRKLLPYRELSIRKTRSITMCIP